MDCLDLECPGHKQKTVSFLAIWYGQSLSLSDRAYTTCVTSLVSAFACILILLFVSPVSYLRVIWTVKIFYNWYFALLWPFTDKLHFHFHDFTRSDFDSMFVRVWMHELHVSWTINSSSYPTSINKCICLLFQAEQMKVNR